MRLSVSLTAFLFTAVLSGPVSASIEQALDWHAEGRSEEARRLLHDLAEAGDVLAQYNLAVMLEGVDPGLAARWYARAARAGDGRAAHNLGHLYLAGRGVPKDAGAAREAFQRAAELAQPEGLYNVGILQESGLGGAQDRAAAERSYQRAVELKHPGAALRLAQFHRERDVLVALYWLSRAESLGAADAQLRRQLRAASGGQWRKIKGRIVNLRAGPGKREKILDKLKRGTEVLVLERRGDWRRVGLPGRSPLRGWVFASLLK